MTDYWLIRTETAAPDLLEACEKAREAIRDNLKAHAYKNEEVLHEAFLELLRVTKLARGGRR